MHIHVYALKSHPEQCELALRRTTVIGWSMFSVTSAFAKGKAVATSRLTLEMTRFSCVRDTTTPHTYHTALERLYNRVQQSPCCVGLLNCMHKNILVYDSDLICRNKLHWMVIKIPHSPTTLGESVAIRQLTPLPHSTTYKQASANRKREQVSRSTTIDIRPLEASLVQPSKASLRVTRNLLPP